MTQSRDEAPGRSAGASDEQPSYGGALAGIAKRHEEIRSEKSLTLFVPGYEGKMRVRYRLLPEAEMDRQVKRIEEAARTGDRGMAGAMELDADLLVAMCDRIEVRDPDGEDEYQVLEDGDGPVRFERRFAAILRQAGVKVDDRRAKEVVMDFFSPRQDPDNPGSARTHPQALETHTNAIVRWQRGEKETISDLLLGE